MIPPPPEDGLERVIFAALGIAAVLGFGCGVLLMRLWLNH